MNYKVTAYVSEDRNLVDSGNYDKEITFEVQVETPSEILIGDAIFEYINENTDYSLYAYDYEQS